jgi:hypothetical protein
MTASSLAMRSICEVKARQGDLDLRVVCSMVSNSNGVASILVVEWDTLGVNLPTGGVQIRTLVPLKSISLAEWIPLLRVQ